MQEERAFVGSVCLSFWYYHKNIFNPINNNGKKVAGAAAMAHYIYTEMGGMENYNKMMKSEYMKELAFRSLDIAGIIIKSVMKVKRF